jgi:tripartite ATP-independent transporter DctP family solute receptor
MRSLLASALLGLGSLIGAQAASAADITINVGHTNITDAIQDKGLQKLRELLEAKTNGKATLKIFPNGQLGNEGQLAEGTLLGTVEMAMTSNSILSNYVKDFRVLDMPFMFDNIDALSKALRGPASEMMQKSAKASGFQLIGSYSSGIRHLMTKKDIASLADLANLKIRTMQQPMHIEAFRSFGANPTPLAYNELYGALQTGVVDGAEGATSDYRAQRFYEVASHFSLVGWLNLTAHVYMSQAKFASLPKDVQTALLEAGRESALWQHKHVVEQEEPLLTELRTKGVKIVKPELAAFKAAAKPVYVKFLETDSQRALFQALSQ